MSRCTKKKNIELEAQAKGKSLTLMMKQVIFNLLIFKYHILINDFKEKWSENH